MGARSTLAKPQTLNPKQNPQRYQGEYGREVDIWAIGITLYLLLSAQLPFADITSGTFGFGVWGLGFGVWLRVFGLRQALLTPTGMSTRLKTLNPKPQTVNRHEYE
jgi:serine/threonine protein kinase